MPRMLILAALAGYGLVLNAASAQSQPDAGRLLQEIEPRHTAPTEPSVDLDTEAPTPGETTEEGGATIRLEAISFEGHSVFSEAELRTALPDSTLDEPHDLAGLRQLANRITEHYREAGYPFARAILPPQDLGDRHLTIRVLEGRYGAIAAEGDDDALVDFAQGFLARLDPGNVIHGPDLERTTLILGDQPGISVRPVLQPGEETGTGDLRVAVSEGERLSGGVSVDNHGNRYSGEWRTRANLAGNRLLLPGDRLRGQVLYTEEDLWLGGMRYALPLGASGLRGHVRYARSEYDLRAPFEGFTGTTDTAETGLRYPFHRSRQSNLDLTATYRYQDLSNEVEGFEYDARSIHTLPLGVRFDHRDELGVQGVTFGRVAATPGRVSADVGDNEDDSFIKVHGQVARQQRLPAGWRAFAQVRGQWADVPLPSAETLTLGGASGVRAYPQGEGSGSRGILARTELRRPLTALPGGRWMPFAFYDTGVISQWENETRRSIAGGGLGLRWGLSGWHAEVTAAWKSSGGDPRSDSNSRNPRALAEMGYRF
ncbi:MAG: ShlB/FhaC/HecB family hemolysin secretion/activation protein [Halorhodospira sp.]